MRSGIIRWSIRKFLAGSDPADKDRLELCDECRYDLRKTDHSEAECRTGFEGPFLIRKEKGYFVATLPSHLHLGLGSADIPWKLILEQARKQSPELPRRPGFYTTTFSYGYSSEEERLLKGRAAIEAALKDSDKRVVRLARELKKNLAGEIKSSSRPATSAQELRGQIP